MGFDSFELSKQPELSAGWIVVGLACLLCITFVIVAFICYLTKAAQEIKRKGPTADRVIQVQCTPCHQYIRKCDRCLRRRTLCGCDKVRVRENQIKRQQMEQKCFVTMPRNICPEMKETSCVEIQNENICIKKQKCPEKSAVVSVMPRHTRIGCKCLCGNEKMVLMKCKECSHPTMGCSKCLRRQSPCICDDSALGSDVQSVGTRSTMCVPISRSRTARARSGSLHRESLSSYRSSAAGKCTNCHQLRSSCRCVSSWAASLAASSRQSRASFVPPVSRVCSC